MPTTVVDPRHAAIRFVAALNDALWRAPGVAPGADVAAAQVMQDDAAHHVVDQASLLGLDPFHATDLGDALPHLWRAESEGWVLALPRPGATGSLRGPVETNRRAVECGAAVIGWTSGVALLPQVVGAGAQWLVMPASRPATPPTPYEAERALSETILTAERELLHLDLTGTGEEPTVRSVRLPGSYGSRRQPSLDRALRLFTACSAAVDDDGAAISSHQLQRRRAAITPLVGLSADVIVAICSTPPEAGRRIA